MLTHSQLTLSAARVAVLFQQLNRVQDSESITTRVHAQHDKAERQDRVNGNGRQQYQDVRPVGEVGEQEEPDQESHFDGSGSKERNLGMALATFYPIKRRPT